MSASANKSATKKKVGRKSPDLDLVMLVIEEPMERPIFRYIPDRATVQRLVTRCTALKDDSTKFEPVSNEKKVGDDLF